MIRIALISAGFFAITLALIVFQPTAGIRAPSPDLAGPAIGVTRANTGLDTVLAEENIPQVNSVIAARSEPTLVPEPALIPEAAPQAAPAPEATTTGLAIDAGLEDIIMTALKQGQSEGYIDALVNQAARDGDMAMPSDLVTSDGRVNTNAMLSALTERALTEGPGAGLYVVQPGDTLATIAYRFYGQTRYSTEIFNANRDALGAMAQLKVGQTLVMPAL
ncbi:LysM peptidoglycan-binding domain-containing protein [Roseovarius sp. LXJ103]|uniref:LysM peptidoglycan-binding domain-containing protein n=1 Tax=Roseovarius carneus TaxID=2853164 RepID=UPI000D60B07A|nr:LysM domain-containing protein [Roseovarius carneus]MBZ8118406.1 LysM peptidoglycan-binding domain-containing protein [Roseovarius carneus]PWE35888.1 hypothetical protein DD563_07910 [Pelagicola sp. LXJ1103]